jgi:hypothetical protein
MAERVNPNQMSKTYQLPSLLARRRRQGENGSATVVDCQAARSPLAS